MKLENTHLAYFGGNKLGKNTQKLQNAVLTFIASQLSQFENLQEITEVFRELDRNGDGKISKEELIAVSKTKGIALLGGSVQHIMKEVDVNHSGFIDYTEFLIAFRKFGKNLLALHK